MYDVNLDACRSIAVLDLFSSPYPSPTSHLSEQTQSSTFLTSYQAKMLITADISYITPKNASLLCRLTNHQSPSFCYYLSVSIATRFGDFHHGRFKYYFLFKLIQQRYQLAL